MPEAAHPLPDLPRGWKSIPPAELDGRSWTLGIAAELLDIPERDLRDLVRITGLVPAGTIDARPYRSQGRAARAYPARSLILITENMSRLRNELDSPGADR